jgi:hypothetical protein
MTEAAWNDNRNRGPVTILVSGSSSPRMAGGKEKSPSEG